MKKNNNNHTHFSGTTHKSLMIGLKCSEGEGNVWKLFSAAWTPFFSIWNEGWTVQSWMRTTVAFKGMQFGRLAFIGSLCKVCASRVLSDASLEWLRSWTSSFLLRKLRFGLAAIIEDRQEREERLLWKGHCKTSVINQNVQIPLGWVEKPTISLPLQ